MFWKTAGIVILFSIFVTIVYFFVILMFERRRHNKKEKEFRERARNQQKIDKFSDRPTKYVPTIGISILKHSNVQTETIFYGRLDEISDLLAPELRKNKILRDMIKSAF